mmetsp:Transcript_64060/g.115251  ORF Transcript_64060/g.115251 Transcript_64060/m.115251 type:complete len:238 (-) Transcript_64060:720-1433(-)
MTLPLFIRFIINLDILLKFRRSPDNNFYLVISMRTGEANKGLVTLSDAIDEFPHAACQDLLTIVCPQISLRLHTLEAWIAQKTAVEDRHPTPSVDRVDVVEGDERIQRQTSVQHADLSSNDMDQWKFFKAAPDQFIHTLRVQTPGSGAVRVDEAIVRLQILLLILMISSVHENPVWALEFQGIERHQNFWSPGSSVDKVAVEDVPDTSWAELGVSILVHDMHEVCEVPVQVSHHDHL